MSTRRARRHRQARGGVGARPAAAGNLSCPVGLVPTHQPVSPRPAARPGGCAESRGATFGGAAPHGAFVQGPGAQSPWVRGASRVRAMIAAARREKRATRSTRAGRHACGPSQWEQAFYHGERTEEHGGPRSRTELRFERSALNMLLRGPSWPSDLPSCGKPCVLANPCRAVSVPPAGHGGNAFRFRPSRLI